VSPGYTEGKPSMTKRAEGREPGSGVPEVENWKEVEMEELEWVKCPYCHKEILGKSERASHISARHPEHSLEGMAVVEMQYPGHWFRDGKPKKVRTRVLGRPGSGDQGGERC